MGTENNFIEINLIILTWVTFIVLLFILKKYAWLPILQKLQQREITIQRSLEEADRIKEEYTKINQKYQEVINRARKEAESILQQSRQAALEIAHASEHKSREEAQIIIQSALREIKEETQKAQAILRKESAQIAIELAGKLLEENLDDEKNRKLVNELIKRI